MNSTRVIAAFFLIGLLGPVWGESTWAQGFTESWYMSRGRANMKIGNYKAAIEAFEKVLEKNPNNKEAMRSLGLAYEGQGLKDKAIDQFDRYLEKHPDDAEIAFKQAESLEWSRYAYRQNDVLKYYRMGLSKRDDVRMRLKYAKLLAQNKEGSQEAITQFEKVLRKEPHNPEAHKGLAKAYAWLGYHDRALHHTNLAVRYSRKQTDDLVTLRRDLKRGRGPKVEGELPFFIQPQKPFDLKGLRLGAKGKHDLTAFSTSTIEVGYEGYWNTLEDTSGGYFSLGTQYRINPTSRVDGLLEHHSFARNGGEVVFNISYTTERGGRLIRPGFKRELRYDSFMALAGSTASGTLLGLARSNLFYTQLTFGLGSYQFDVTPFLGWVSAESLSPNEQLGIELKTEVSLLRDERRNLAAEYLLYMIHYGADHSGFQPSAVEPLPGGYFSPRIFINQIPRLALTFTPQDDRELRFAGGPAIQYVDEATKNASFRMGADIHASYTVQLPERLLLKLMGDLTQISNVYSRFQMNFLLVYTF